MLVAALRYIDIAVKPVDRKALFVTDSECSKQYTDVLAHILRGDSSGDPETRSTSGLRHAAISSLEKFADDDVAKLLASKKSDLLGALLVSHSQSAEFSVRIVVLLTKALNARVSSFEERVLEDSPFPAVVSALAKHFAIPPPSFASVWKSYGTPSYNLTCVAILLFAGACCVHRVDSPRHCIASAHSNTRAPLRLCATHSAGTRSTRCAF